MLLADKDQPPDGDKIVVFNCLLLYLTPPDFGARPDPYPEPEKGDFIQHNEFISEFQKLNFCTKLSTYLLF